MADRAALGRRGEAVAARYLERRGYVIRTRNYRCPHGEIDLIAVADGYLVFVEVKTRATGQGLHPSLSVTRRKQERLRQLGLYYLAQHEEEHATPLQPRFDVIAVLLDGEAEHVEHIVNAF